MAETSLPPDSLRHAADELRRHAAHDKGAHVEALDRAARVVAEVLLDLAEHRSATVAPHVVDARMLNVGIDPASLSLPSGRPLEVLRSGARDVAERALVAALLARHLGAVLDRRDGVHALRGMLPSLDWLEFLGLYPPYTAARFVLDDETRTRFEDITRAAPVEAPTEAGAAALRALRGAPAATPHPPSPGHEVVPNLAPPIRSVPPGPGGAEGVPISVAGELEGVARTPLGRALRSLSGFGGIAGAFRAVLRVVFVLRSPATITLDGDVLRIKGHTELLGRMLRAYEHHFPLDTLTELRREERFPMLPVAASVVALGVGSIFGARMVIEGAGAVYFPLVALGLGLLTAGLLFDWLMRALFPGLKGRTRLGVRAGDSRALELTELPVSELDRLLEAVASRLRDHTLRVPRASFTLPPPHLMGAEALSAATVRDPEPGPGRHLEAP